MIVGEEDETIPLNESKISSKDISKNFGIHCKRHFKSPKPSSKKLYLAMAEIVEDKINAELTSSPIKKSIYESN